MQAQNDKTLKVPVACIGIDALLDSGRINEALLSALQTKGIVNLYLQCNLLEKKQAIEDAQLLNLLKKRGFAVEAVILPADALDERQLGESYWIKGDNYSACLDMEYSRCSSLTQWQRLYAVFMEKKPQWVGAIFLFIRFQRLLTL